MNYNCSNLLDLRNLQEQVKKAFCYQELFWPFTVWINCLSDLKNFANFRPSASNFKKISRSLEQSFLTVVQNNFGNKIPFTIIAIFLKYLVKMWLNNSLNAPSERTSSYFARDSRLTWCKLIQSETQFALSFFILIYNLSKVQCSQKSFSSESSKEQGPIHLLHFDEKKLKFDPEIKWQTNSFFDIMKFGRLIR